MLLFFGKRDFTNVIKLRILRWGDYSELFHWMLNAITSIFLKGGRVTSDRGANVRTEARSPSSASKDGESQELSSRIWKRQEKRFSSRASE